MITGFSLSFLLQFNIDAVKIEAFSFIRQEITHRLIIVSRSKNQSPLVRSVIDTVIDYFSVFAPVENQSFRLVSQERLFLRAGTSVFIDLIPIIPSGE